MQDDRENFKKFIRMQYIYIIDYNRNLNVNTITRKELHDNNNVKYDVNYENNEKVYSKIHIEKKIPALRYFSIYIMILLYY